MKVTSLELFKVAPRWLFLKVSTDDGLDGWGEPVIEGRADTVAAAVQELSPYVVGRDPAHIEDIFQTLYRGGFYRGGPVLSSAALSPWDRQAGPPSMSACLFCGKEMGSSFPLIFRRGAHLAPDVGIARRRLHFM